MELLSCKFMASPEDVVRQQVPAIRKNWRTRAMVVGGRLSDFHSSSQHERTRVSPSLVIAGFLPLQRCQGTPIADAGARAAWCLI